jgi:hypothetical protein
LSIERVQFQSVRMLGQCLPVERYVILQYERHRVRAEQRQRARGAHRFKTLRDRIGIDGIRRIAHQAEHHAAIGAVTLAGRAERTVQIHFHRSRGRKQSVAFEPLDEHQRRAHRPDRMRAGRTNADFEKVEHTDGHYCSCK